MRNQTNEKISRVKLLLAELENVADSNLAAALAEAVLLELGLAYRCFLNELAIVHGLTRPAPASATALAAKLAEQQLRVAEVDELANLETAQQWPHTLLVVAQPGEQMVPNQAPVKVQDSLINVLQVDEINEDQLNFSKCFEIYEALRACIEHQREMTQEW